MMLSGKVKLSQMETSWMMMMMMIILQYYYIRTTPSLHQTHLSSLSFHFLSLLMQCNHLTPSEPRRIPQSNKIPTLMS